MNITAWWEIQLFSVRLLLSSTQRNQLSAAAASLSYFKGACHIHFLQVCHILGYFCHCKTQKICFVFPPASASCHTEFLILNLSRITRERSKHFSYSSSVCSANASPQWTHWINTALHSFVCNSNSLHWQILTPSLFSRRIQEVWREKKKSKSVKNSKRQRETVAHREAAISLEGGKECEWGPSC